MMKLSILSATIGALIGYGAAFAIHSNQRESVPLMTAGCATAVEPWQLEVLRKEVELKQLENELLIKMVKAGLNGDVASHMSIYRQLPERHRPNVSPTTNPETPALPESNAVTTLEPTAFIERINKADIALQKQALNEGWVNDGQLAQARRELWAEAKETLTEEQYLQGLHGAGIPNVLFFGEPKNQEAAELGLKYGDVLTHVSGVRVYNRDDLRLQLDNGSAGTNVELTFQRGGQTIKVQIANLDKAIELYGDSRSAQQMLSTKS